MKIEKFENGYKTSDFYIASVLLCETDLELAGIEKDGNSRSVLFVIKGDTDKIKKMIDMFFSHKLIVNANLYSVRIKELKSALYAAVPKKG